MSLQVSFLLNFVRFQERTLDDSYEITLFIAGTVGTWWFAPDEASTFCSPAITDSLQRATTYSLGSICFGSLLTALIQVMHQSCRDLERASRGPSMLLCVVEFMLRILESLVGYFNEWAYVYVGLYGYDYLDSGRKVVTLFQQRGWTTIINDHLVARALLLVSLVIGALTGCIGLALAGCTSWMADFGKATAVLAFFIPCIFGWAMSVVLLSVVSSAVDTVIVSFAEAPLEFERNHPGLYTQMCQVRYFAVQIVLALHIEQRFSPFSLVFAHRRGGWLFQTNFSKFPTLISDLLDIFMLYFLYSLRESPMLCDSEHPCGMMSAHTCYISITQFLLSFS